MHICINKHNYGLHNLNFDALFDVPRHIYYDNLSKESSICSLNSVHKNAIA